MHGSGERRSLTGERTSRQDYERATDLSAEEITDVADSKKPVPKVSSGRHTLNIFTTRLFTLPLTIVTSIMVIKELGAAQRGIYEFLALQGGLILPLVMLGFNASATYLVATKRYTVNDVFVTCLSVSMLQGMVCMVMLGTLWYCGLLGKTAAATQPAVIIPVLLILPLQSSILSLTRLAQGDSWFALNNRAQLAIALLTALSLWVLVIFAGLGIQGSVIGVVATNTVVFFAILIAFLRRYRPTLAFHGTYLREAWRYGLKAWVGDVAVQTNARMDKLVLGAVDSPETLGVYGPVVLITEMLWLVPDSISFVLLNKLAAARDKQEQARLLERVNRLVFWTMAAAAGAVLMAAPPLMVLVWGPDYAGGRAPMALLMPGTVIFCVSKLLNKYFAGTGRPHYSGATVIVGAIVGMSLYGLFIPVWGVNGAALAHSACYIATAVAAVVIYRKLVLPHKPRLLLPEMTDVTWLRQQVRTAAGTR
jgi:O-antigen/teichoic acid export membrane protein